MARKLPQVLTEDEVFALLAAPNVRSITGLRNRAMLELMAYGGLRVGEVVNLRPGHIRWDSGEVEIKNGKGGQERVVPLHATVMDWLHRWNEQRPKHSRYFFTTISGEKKGSQLSSRYPDQMVKRHAKEAGIQEVEYRNNRPHYKVHCHALRHTFASRMLSQGFTLAEVQALLGHSNIITTSVYLHTNPKALREKIQSQPTREEREMDAQELEEAGRKLLELAAQRRRTE